MDNSEPDVGIDVVASPSRAAAPRESAESSPASKATEATSATENEATAGTPRPAARKRRRGSRGGKNRKKPVRPAVDGAAGLPDDADDELDDDDDFEDDDDDDLAEDADRQVVNDAVDHADHPEMPDRISENRPSAEAASKALVRKPQIGDTRPAAPSAAPATPTMPGQRQNGQPRERITWVRDGNRRVAQVESFNDAGVRTFSGSRDERGRPLGVHRNYDSRGTLRLEQTFDDGGRPNRRREFDERGGLSADDEVFADGSRKAFAK